MPSILNLFSQLCFPLAAFGVPSIGFHVGISPLSAASWQTLKTWEWFRARISIGQAAASTGTMRGEAGLPLVQAAKTSHPSWGPQTLTAGLRTDYGISRGLCGRVGPPRTNVRAGRGAPQREKVEGVLARALSLSHRCGHTGRARTVLDSVKRGDVCRDPAYRLRLRLRSLSKSLPHTSGWLLLIITAVLCKTGA
jgi:hypothetical protein